MCVAWPDNQQVPLFPFPVLHYKYTQKENNCSVCLMNRCRFCSNCCDVFTHFINPCSGTCLFKAQSCVHVQDGTGLHYAAFVLLSVSFWFWKNLLFINSVDMYSNGDVGEMIRCSTNHMVLCSDSCTTKLIIMLVSADKFSFFNIRVYVVQSNERWREMKKIQTVPFSLEAQEPSRHTSAINWKLLEYFLHLKIILHHTFELD